MISRRTFIAALAAPLIIRPGILMPIKPVLADDIVFYGPDNDWVPGLFKRAGQLASYDWAYETSRDMVTWERVPGFVCYPNQDRLISGDLDAYYDSKPARSMSLDIPTIS